LVQQVVLHETPDEISWPWTMSGAYTSKSAYLPRFTRSYRSFDGNSIWSAHAERKHKFFGWLLVRSKIRSF
ncbi:hypothetical protein BAE44_0007081, partial [Dichanthelium oligosanthes]